jgi:large subunit ribosomal protein L22
MANARQAEGFGGDVDRLFVSSRYADQGPGMKRVRPAPMGRAFRVVKRTTHLTVAVKERPGKKLAAGGSTASKSRAARVAGSKKAAGAQGATAAKSKAKAAAGTE